MSRRVVIAGAVMPGAVISRKAKGKLADTGPLLDALLEASRQPRGHFLRLYRERRDAKAATAADGRTRADGGES